MSLRLKRNYPLLVGLGLILAVLMFGFGSQRIVAYTVSGGRTGGAASQQYTSSIPLFDGSLVHSVQLLMDDETYDSMITTFRQTGEKEYFHADVVIDGIKITDVGVRLKGNASLRTALGVGFGGPGGFGGQPGQDPPSPAQGQPNRPGAANQPAGGPGGGRNTQVPLMIKFDEFVAGQKYQGYDRIAIRSSGINYDASMLQEPVTNSMLALIGMPATRTAYTGFQRNSEPERLFTISEVIEESFIEEHFANNGGVLYKAELMANLSYQGEDPSAYARSFTQETRVNDADLAPLIKFLKFISQANDSEFEQRLDEYLDVDAFAAYLAFNNLLVNTDSMAGMGNNFYLYYDNETGRMTILMWDANEGLGKHGAGGFDRRGSSADSASYDIYSIAPVRAGPGMRGGSNPLLTRFMASPKFKALFEQQARVIYRKIFASGAIEAQIEAYTRVVRQANASRSLVETSAYDSAVASVKDFVARRAAYLAATPLLSGQATAP